MKYVNIIKYIANVMILGVFLFWAFRIQSVTGNQQKEYIGPEACKSCHEKEFNSFFSFAKKSNSFEHILKMKKGLTPVEFESCFKCHTTGFGEPGGFKNENETPQLKNPTCEVCHGPGSIHIQTQNPDDIIRKLTVKDCETCHVSERINSFKYRPLIHGGAH